MQITTNTPRTIVNGASMRLSTGKLVSITVLVAEYNGSSTTMNGQSTDDSAVIINLRSPLGNSINNLWVEVIGTVSQPNTITANDVILLPEGDNLDKVGHNMMIQLLNNATNVYNIH
ncbi:hypothetical protein DMENIID0001_067310 [Sergentomyia squamirostris]